MLHIDIETYSSVDLAKPGMYAYMESIDFEILMVAYAYGNDPVNIIDLAQGEELPDTFIEDLLNPKIKKYAHNAAFERNAFNTVGLFTNPKDWHCSLVKSAYCGFPLSLQKVSEALQLTDKAKDTKGKALIRYFCLPCKPTKTNGGRLRNLPHHAPEKWQAFKDYCKQDVVAEREVCQVLKPYKVPASEWQLYAIDQHINDAGIRVDTQLAKQAIQIDEVNSRRIKKRLIEITSLENPNSPGQLKKWLSDQLQKEVKSIAKGEVKDLLSEAVPGPVRQVLELRQRGSKTSIKKYIAMLKCAGVDSRARGLFQFYGANKTGRWAGRLIQLQNLPRNYLKDLDLARQTVLTTDYDTVSLLFGQVSSVLSQLIRTAFIPSQGKVFAIADFSAIEARVIAWIAGEQWRLDVFKTHGKIYEASASRMFNVPIEQIDKGSDLRYKGKVAELALGYQGGTGALKTMGGEAMGLSDTDMRRIVKYWRDASPNIVKFWYALEKAAVRAIKTSKIVRTHRLIFQYANKALAITLPSGRNLYYPSPVLKPNRFDKESIWYMGTDQITRKWQLINTYGGKLAENVTQAIARDLLADALTRVYQEGYKIVMHVHDELVCEVDKARAERDLTRICNIMGEAIKWAPSLPLNADGFLSDYYKKD